MKDYASKARRKMLRQEFMDQLRDYGFVFISGAAVCAVVIAMFT